VLSRIFKRASQEDQQKIERSLERTRRGVFGQLASLFQANELDEEFWDDLEALLIQSDVGVATTERLLNRFRQN